MAWDQTKNQICKRALRMCGVVAQGDDPYPEQLSEASDALNAFLKTFNIGTKLWKVRWFSLALNSTTTNIVGSDGKIYEARRGHKATLANQPASGNEYQGMWKETGIEFDLWATGEAYVIGDKIVVNNTGYKVYTCTVDHTAGATFAGDIANWSQDTTYTAWVVNTAYNHIGDVLLPLGTLEVIDCWYRDNSTEDEDTPIQLISGKEYASIWEKEDTDTYPDYAAVEKSIPQYRLYLNKIPLDRTSFVLYVKTEEVCDDLINPGDNPNVNQNFYDVLTFGLAVRLCPEYGITGQIKNDLRTDFVEALNIYKARSHEDVTEETIASNF